MAPGERREPKTGSRDHRPSFIANAQEKRELREAAREYTERALRTLAAICSEGQSEAARVSAA